MMAEINMAWEKRREIEPRFEGLRICDKNQGVSVAIIEVMTGRGNLSPLIL